MANSVLTDNFLSAMAGQGSLTPIDFDSDSLFVLLVDATGTAESDATKQGHVFRSDITHEVTGTGYTTGGQALTSLSLAMSSHIETFSAANASWAASTITASGAWIYKAVGSAGTDVLIGYWDFGGSVSSSSGTFLISWNSSGILAWAHA